MNPDKNNIILLVSNSSKGMYRFRRKLIEAIAQRGYEVHVISPRDRFSEPLKELPYKYIPLPLQIDSTRAISELKTIRFLISYYRKHKPLLAIHFTIKPNVYGSFASWLTGCKSWMVVAGLGHPFEQDDFLKKLAQFLYKKAGRKAEKAFFLNSENLNFFKEENLISSEKGVLLPGEGVDLNFYKRKTPYPNKIKFYFIGRLIIPKGIELYIEAAQSLAKTYPKIYFKILGELDASKVNSVSDEFVKSLENTNIEYLGSTHDVRPYLEEASCLVLPSFYGEGMPRTLLEAAAMEIPLITTDHVGCRDVIIDGETGFLIPPRDENVLLSVMEKFISLPYTERKEMGIKGREFVSEHYAIEKVLAVYQKEMEDSGL